MRPIIEIYDSFLIYYPNIFFPLLFVLSILGLIFLIKGVIFLNREFTEIVKRVKINLVKLKIKKGKGNKIYTFKLAKNIFSLFKTVLNFTTGINSKRKNFELRMEKIIIKIRKEIMID